MNLAILVNPLKFFEQLPLIFAHLFRDGDFHLDMMIASLLTTRHWRRGPPFGKKQCCPWLCPRRNLQVHRPIHSRDIDSRA